MGVHQTGLSKKPLPVLVLPQSAINVEMGRQILKKRVMTETTKVLMDAQKSVRLRLDMNARKNLQNAQPNVETGKW